MFSMTGYGRATIACDGREITVELKSVNHRFLDLNFRMPRSFSFLEDSARRQIGASLRRGHVDVFVQYKNIREDSKTVVFDKALFNAYMSALDSVKGLSDDRTLTSVVKFPDILTVAEAEEDQTALSELMRAALSEAICSVVEMRKLEGEALKKEVSNHVSELEMVVNAIIERYPKTMAEYENKLRASIAELLSKSQDETRLLMEVAMMADRSSIDEETARLTSHISQLRNLFELSEPVGRKIDFLVQELNREVNTISSKSQDVVITGYSVDAKTIIEKLREQIQNIE